MGESIADIKGAPQDRKPDAVLFHTSRVKNLAEGPAHKVLQDQAISLMGARPMPNGRPGVLITRLDHHWRFIRPKGAANQPSAEMNFESGHPLQGQSRYRWFQASETMLVGYLRQEAIDHADEVQANASAPAAPVQVERPQDDK